MTTLRLAALCALFGASILIGACTQETPAPAPPPDVAPLTAPAAVPEAPTAPPAVPPAPALKVYRVGTDATYPPFASRSPSGEIVGFDVDIVEAIAAKAGFAVEFVPLPWEQLFKALSQNDADLLMSAITITDDARTSADFSVPYFNTVQVIAVRADSKVSRFDDLRRLKVGVQTGSAGDDAVSALKGKKSRNIVRFETTPLALEALVGGAVDAVVANNAVVADHLVDHADEPIRTVTDKVFTPEPLGIVVKKGNTELLAAIDKGLAGIKADGVYEQIVRLHFGDLTLAKP